MHPINLGDGRAALKKFERELEHQMKMVYDDGPMSAKQAFDFAKERTRCWIKDAISWKLVVDEELKAAGLIDDTDMKKLCFITVRPDSKKISFFEFKHDVARFMTSSRILSYEYCFEQKGETEATMGIGFHMHAIIQWELEPKELLKYTTSHFKKYVASNCIQIGDTYHGKRIKTKKDLERLRAYMSGDKRDDKKVKACDIDPIWREREGINPLIKSS